VQPNSAQRRDPAARTASSARRTAHVLSNLAARSPSRARTLSNTSICREKLPRVHADAHRLSVYQNLCAYIPLFLEVVAFV